MRGFLRHPFRVTGRMLWFAGEVILAAADYFARVMPQPKASRLQARTRWLQRACRRVLRVFNVTLKTATPFPATGLLVCNHLSYLDILVLSAVTPCLFVAKCEVRRWPVFGWFAARAGTLFVRRDRRADVARSSAEIRRALESGELLVLFPEGTTSDGSQVLPFKSSLLEPAVQSTKPVSVGSIQYALADGNVSQEVCYWKDMCLLPHLINLFSKRGIHVSLRFARVTPIDGNRKELARTLHSQVQALHFN